MDDGRVSIRIATGIGKPKARLSEDRDQAIRFAESHMGRKGVVADTTLMSPAQLATHKERKPAQPH